MGLMKLLCNHLPKGGEYKEARNFIYEEKNTLSKKDTSSSFRASFLMEDHFSIERENS